MTTKLLPPASDAKEYARLGRDDKLAMLLQVARAMAGLYGFQPPVNHRDLKSEFLNRRTSTCVHFYVHECFIFLYECFMCLYVFCLVTCVNDFIWCT